MVVLRAKNPNLNNFEKTEVATAITAGDTSITVDNTNGFGANDYIVIGDKGSDLREMVQISSVNNGTTLTVSAVSFAHAVDEPIFKTPYNQVIFQSSSSQTGTFTNRATNNIDWDNADDFSVFDYTAGSTSDWFRYKFYNSQTGVESQTTTAVQIPTYYCTAADVADYLNITISDDSEIPFKDVIKAIKFASSEVDNLTNSSFKTNTISTDNYEYQDGKISSDPVYFTKNKPILSVTSLQTTLSDKTVGVDNATWNTLTEDDDFHVNKEIGAITIVDSTVLPEKGDSRFRVAYTWGHSSIPGDVRLLTTLLAVKHLMKGGVAKNLVLGRDGTGANNVDLLNNQIDKLSMSYRYGGIENT